MDAIIYPCPTPDAGVAVIEKGALIANQFLA